MGLYSLSWFYDPLIAGVGTDGAERVLAGEIPHRDFWTMYAPGQFYLLAVLFRIFGTHLLVEVVAASVLCTAAACVCYWLVMNLGGRRTAAVTSAAIFVAATFLTGYCKRIGSYPPSILFVFIAMTFMVLYYKTRKQGYLIAAGLATGAVAVFKHDVGGYTAIAIITGLMVHHFLVRETTSLRLRSLLLKLTAYSAGTAAIALPVLIYFGILAGPDMFENLIVFPLTDFPFARPEGYPSLIPLWIYDESPLRMLAKFFHYVIFTVPFVLFLLGIIATVLAIRRRRPEYAAASATFSVGYLLHYSAAHVQINTHIITMSVYAFWLGVIFYDLVGSKFFTGKHFVIRLLVPGLLAGWLLSLSARPIYDAWKFRKTATVELRLTKISGLMTSPRKAHTLSNLVACVHQNLSQGQELFAGMHRHDVIVASDTMIYFILDRPSATRYHELHPAIADTAPIQNEIINDLQRKNVSLIILKRMFSDKVLDRVKEKFLINLPQIGATELDEFIRENFTKIEQFGSYAVWKKKERITGIHQSQKRMSEGS
jgi:hypothetical protein